MNNHYNMTKRLKIKSIGLIASAACIFSSTVTGQLVLDFEGLGNSEGVGEFYNGGTGSNGSSTGLDYNITFTPDALAIVDADAGGGGNFGNEPTPDTILFFLQGSAVMNVLDGFDTGFSFFYTSTNNVGFVSVYDDFNATGNVLATLQLPALGNGPGDPNGDFSNWDAVGVSFLGIGKSVDFSGTANRIGFDNITLGASSPIVPEPSAIASVLTPLGLGLVLWMRRRKKAKA